MNLKTLIGLTALSPYIIGSALSLSTTACAPQSPKIPGAVKTSGSTPPDAQNQLTQDQQQLKKNLLQQLVEAQKAVLPTRESQQVSMAFANQISLVSFSISTPPSKPELSVRIETVAGSTLPSYIGLQGELDNSKTVALTSQSATEKLNPGSSAIKGKAHCTEPSCLHVLVTLSLQKPGVPENQLPQLVYAVASSRIQLAQSSVDQSTDEKLIAAAKSLGIAWTEMTESFASNDQRFVQFELALHQPDGSFENEPSIVVSGEAKPDGVLEIIKNDSIKLLNEVKIGAITGGEISSLAISFKNNDKIISSHSDIKSLPILIKEKSELVTASPEAVAAPAPEAPATLSSPATNRPVPQSFHIPAAGEYAKGYNLKLHLPESNVAQAPVEQPPAEQSTTPQTVENDIALLPPFSGTIPGSFVKPAPTQDQDPIIKDPHSF